MTTEEKAISTFREGLNCAQAVFAAFAVPLEYDPALAIQAAAGFGGGMGRLQQSCGVVTGAYMVLGMHNARNYPENAMLKEKTYEMVREFNRRFVAEHGSDQCAGLIGVDLSTAEGRALAKTLQVHEKICEECMATSVRILNDLIK